ncbi:CdaR family transcriptional regulator [Thermobispora bispora]|uniref:PucR family transcriptional regulator n=1 Tax=Thermobispora bispora TaxID=2006 RepID=UPI00197FFBD4|nr:PucR family transcriptional regulator ligand-binding domain-containing protein [Thermobispora bispora]MBO2475934.1 CdaR family transcriptional regulator [Actinomycetales bacterium]MBX6168261.1 PucR family transcriptional regulator ligand-binding domain-containing protein [Thermobispora bispora]MDI9580690.1 PucR family transcriptional regulator ligand-binding domain-containing protein [Thermobispora sp.]QSI47656.1 PucR family transcriptional regulator [Thermobispora bispora]
MLPTVADVLALDAVRRGDPRVVAGADRLDTRVRWVHVGEIYDIAQLLRGGELVLTTGVALPDDPAKLVQYVADLAAVGAAGLIVELGRRFVRELPPAIVEAAEEHGLPLITLSRETPFVQITESVHERIIDIQLEELRASKQLHDVFTELSVEGASPAEVLAQVARFSGRPVLLENLAHQVLACDPAGQETETILANWETRSRAVSPGERTAYDAASGWLVTMVGARGQDWGRLILFCEGPPSPRDIVLAERAATTLALSRLLERHQESLERQAHGTVLSGILSHAYSDPDEAAARARALGVPLTGRRLLSAVIRPITSGGTALGEQARLGELAEAAAAACREGKLPALVGTLDQNRVGMLIPLPPRASAENVLGTLSERLRAVLPASFVLAAGSVVESLKDVRRSFLEAEQVAEVAVRQPDGRPYYRLPDLRLRGLLHLLRDDARLQTFAERELGPLLAYDAQRNGDLTKILRIYLDSGRNKAVAAQRAHLSRPAFYDRLRRLERILGTDLDDVESCLSLHVALLALETFRNERG